MWIVRAVVFLLRDSAQSDEHPQDDNELCDHAHRFSASGLLVPSGVEGAAGGFSNCLATSFHIQPAGTFLAFFQASKRACRTRISCCSSGMPAVFSFSSISWLVTRCAWKISSSSLSAATGVTAGSGGSGGRARSSALGGGSTRPPLVTGSDTAGGGGGGGGGGAHHTKTNQTTH